VSEATSGQATLAKGIVELQKRVEEEKAAASTTEVKLDGTNKVSFPGFEYKFEALGRKILVSIDIFKSGYECKMCKGAKKLQEKCLCETLDRPGFKYSSSHLEEIENSLGLEVANVRRGTVCPICNGDYLSQRRDLDCPECKGQGALLVLPETSKQLPTTGVVVSKGYKCKRTDFKIGDRIVFGPYAGNMIPTKAGLMFKILDEVQAWCKIEGGDDLAAFDFVVQDDL
jgi:co-chaperonin GroES (HSP10)